MLEVCVVPTRPVKFDQFALITAGFPYNVCFGVEMVSNRKSLKMTRYNF